jgi:hypothetical protein
MLQKMSQTAALPYDPKTARYLGKWAARCAQTINRSPA